MQSIYFRSFIACYLATGLLSCDNDSSSRKEPTSNVSSISSSVVSSELSSSSSSSSSQSSQPPSQAAESQLKELAENLAVWKSQNLNTYSYTTGVLPTGFEFQSRTVYNVQVTNNEAKAYLLYSNWETETPLGGQVEYNNYTIDDYFDILKRFLESGWDNGSDTNYRLNIKYAELGYPYQYLMDELDVFDDESNSYIHLLTGAFATDQILSLQQQWQEQQIHHYRFRLTTSFPYPIESVVLEVLDNQVIDFEATKSPLDESNLSESQLEQVRERYASDISLAELQALSHPLTIQGLYDLALAHSQDKSIALSFNASGTGIPSVFEIIARAELLGEVNDYDELREIEYTVSEFESL